MPQQRHTPDNIARAEHMVARIKGVSSCRIATDSDGQITEVHVVALGGKPAKLVARDVETCLKAELGIAVDYKKIGVVVVESERGENQWRAEAERVVELPIEEHPSRFSFQSVNMFVSEESVQAEVELVRDGVETFGSAQSANVGGSAAVVAEATLKAIAELLDEPVRLCLSGVREVPVGAVTAIIVTADLVRGRDKKSLVGCSLVADNVSQTIVFATLDAVNRVIGKFRAKKSIEYRIE